MDIGVVFSPLPGPPVGATRPFSDWMRAAETACTTLAGAGFRSIVFTHSYPVSYTHLTLPTILRV